MRSTRDASGISRRRSRWRTVVLLCLCGMVVASAALTARLFIWPDLPPIPAHVDAIVELAGSDDHGRDQRAIQLAEQGRAPYLIQSTATAEAGTHRCLPAPTTVTVLCFHADPPTTRGEAEYIGRVARVHGWTSVVLVTTPDQAWRARLRVTRCFPGKVYVATSHLPFLDWFHQIPYQWGATAKALVWERAC